MTLIFFSEHWKLDVDIKNTEKEKMQEKVYGFLDNFIWIGTGKFSLFLREYSQFPVNALSSSSRISDLIENYFFWLNLAQHEEKVG